LYPLQLLPVTYSTLKLSPEDSVMCCSVRLRQAVDRRFEHRIQPLARNHVSAAKRIVAVDQRTLARQT
jgi:hypothetical protein